MSGRTCGSSLASANHLSHRGDASGNGALCRRGDALDLPRLHRVRSGVVSYVLVLVLPRLLASQGSSREKSGSGTLNHWPPAASSCALQPVLLFLLLAEDHHRGAGNVATLAIHASPHLISRSRMLERIQVRVTEAIVRAILSIMAASIRIPARCFAMPLLWAL